MIKRERTKSKSTNTFRQFIQQIFTELQFRWLNWNDDSPIIWQRRHKSSNHLHAPGWLVVWDARREFWGQVVVDVEAFLGHPKDQSINLKGDKTSRQVQRGEVESVISYILCTLCRHDLSLLPLFCRAAGGLQLLLVTSVQYSATLIYRIDTEPFKPR